MTTEAFITVDDKNLTKDELRQMLQDAFDAGCELGFKGGLEGAKNAAHSHHCKGCENEIDQVCGPNVFAVMVGFEDYLKKKGGKA